MGDFTNKHAGITWDNMVFQLQKWVEQQKIMMIHILNYSEFWLGRCELDCEPVLQGLE